MKKYLSFLAVSLAVFSLSVSTANAESIFDTENSFQLTKSFKLGRSADVLTSNGEIGRITGDGKGGDDIGGGESTRKLCGSTCTNCNTKTGVCSKCISGYYVSAGSCAKCSDSCKTCTSSASTCTSCYANTRLSGNKCVSNCEGVVCSDGYSPEVNASGCCCKSSCGDLKVYNTKISKCVDMVCPSNCSDCSKGYCVSCNSGYYLDYNNGYCPACSTAVANCATCTSKTTGGATCTKCNAGYYLNNGACTACPAGTYSAAGATSCTACPAGKYSAPGASSCSSCPIPTNGTACSACTYDAAYGSKCTSGTCKSGYGWWATSSSAPTCNKCTVPSNASSCTACQYDETYGQKCTSAVCKSGYTWKAGIGGYSCQKTTVTTGCGLDMQDCGATGCCPTTNTCAYYAQQAASGKAMCLLDFKEVGTYDCSNCSTGGNLTTGKCNDGSLCLMKALKAEF